MTAISYAGIESIDALAGLYGELHAEHVAVTPVLCTLPALSIDAAWRNRREHYREWFADERTFVVLARLGDGLAGYAFVRIGAGYDGWAAREDDAVGEVKDLVVAARARRRGVGAALLDAARARLAGMGIPALRLEVLTANATAIAFYERYGMTEAITTLSCPTPRAHQIDTRLA